MLASSFRRCPIRHECWSTCSLVVKSQDRRLRLLCRSRVVQGHVEVVNERDSLTAHAAQSPCRLHAHLRIWVLQTRCNLLCEGAAVIPELAQSLASCGLYLRVLVEKLLRNDTGKALAILAHGPDASDGSRHDKVHGVAHALEDVAHVARCHLAGLSKGKEGSL